MSAPAPSSGSEFAQESDTTARYGNLLFKMWNDVESLQRRNTVLRSELERDTEKLENTRGLISEECRGQIQHFIDGLNSFIATALAPLLQKSESTIEAFNQNTEKLESLLGLILSLEELLSELSRKLSSVSEVSGCNHSCMTGEELTSQLVEMNNQIIEGMTRRPVRSESTQVEMETTNDHTAVSTDMENSLAEVTSDDNVIRGCRRNKNERVFSSDETDNEPGCDSETPMPTLELEDTRRTSKRMAAKTARARLAKISRGGKNTSMDI